jgi:hypothetical protein
VVTGCYAQRDRELAQTSARGTGWNRASDLGRRTSAPRSCRSGRFEELRPHRAAHI